MVRNIASVHRNSQAKLFISYMPTVAAKDQNDHVSDALEANKDVVRLKSEKKYVGLSVGNQKDSGSMMLLDPDFTFGNLVGAPHKIVTSILVDKERIIRYIYSGKTPMANIPQIIDLI